MYTHIYIYTYLFIYIYIYIERERESEIRLYTGNWLYEKILIKTFVILSPLTEHLRIFHIFLKFLNFNYVSYLSEAGYTSASYRFLTHWGRVTQICVFTLQLCKTDDANLLF